MNPARRAALALALLPTVALSGCLVGRQTKTEVQGTYVGPDTIAQITPGKSEAYVVALLGTPSSKTDVGNGNWLWKWHYVERKTSSGSVLFVFGGSSEHETQSTSYVEFREGQVVHAWRD